MSLPKSIQMLRSFHGPPDPPITTDPFEQILFENVGYLIADEKREAAFAALKQSVGLTPAEILGASDDALYAVAKLGGMLPEQRVDRLRGIAALAMETVGGDTAEFSTLPVPKARSILRRFPGIGDPSADRILLFARRSMTLGGDSNVLRVLRRLGYGEESKNYATMYRSVMKAIEGQLGTDHDALIAAHQLLRRHGKTLCRRDGPTCEPCPLKKRCEYFKQSSR